MFHNQFGYFRESAPDQDLDLMCNGAVGPCTMGKVLGSGAFGVVYKGYHKRLKRVVAVKSVDLKGTKRCIRRKERGTLQREMEIMKKCSHPNIIDFVDFLQDGDSRFLLIVQFCGGGNLSGFMDNVLKRQPMEEDKAKFFGQQIWSGLSYLHSQKPPIIHRDLKPANILMSNLTDRATLYIADFGEANFKRSMGKTKLQTLAGTPMYMAPELLKAEQNGDDNLEYGSSGNLQSVPSSYLSLSVHCNLCAFTQLTCGRSALFSLNYCSENIHFTKKRKLYWKRLCRRI